MLTLSLTFIALIVLLFGLILLATGAVLSLRVKNKLAGVLVLAVGLVLTVCPIIVYLFVLANVQTQG